MKLPPLREILLILVFSSVIPSIPLLWVHDVDATITRIWFLAFLVGSSSGTLAMIVIENNKKVAK